METSPVTSNFDSRLSSLRAWLVLLARLHLDFRHQDREASDVVQEALVDAVKYRDKLVDLENSELEHWLRRVLRNKVIDFYRKKRPEVSEADLDGFKADVYDSFRRLDDLVSDKGSSPSERMIRQEERQQLAAALEELSASSREVVMLKDLAGWTLAELAERLGCTIGVIAGRLRRARNELKQLLDSHE